MRGSGDIAVISDPGVDDIVALVLLEKLARRRRKVLISTFGNCNAVATDKNCQAFAAYRQDRWQYQQGAALPFNGAIERPWADNYHGQDGVWGVPFPPSDTLPKFALQAKKNDVISLGPLTEAYRLLVAGQLKKLTVMGGAFATPGNETDCTEFNIAMDPDAAHLLFANCQGMDLRVVPMDATQAVRWSLSDVRQIPAINQTNRWLKQLLLAWFRNYQYASQKQFVLYDPLAVYLAFKPQSAVWVRSGVEVVGAGRQRGRTVFSAANPSCTIAMAITEPQRVAQEIFNIVFGMTHMLD